jgi:hypothetical protein
MFYKRPPNLQEGDTRIFSYDRTTSGRGSSARINLSDSQQSENIINTHKYVIPYIKV